MKMPNKEVPMMDNMVLIGSRRWHCATEKSDYDMCCSVEDAKEIEKHCFDAGIQIDSNDRYVNKLFNKYSTKFTVDGKEVNLIVYDVPFLDNINKINDTIDAMLTTEVGLAIFKDRTKRYLMVEALFSAVFSKPIDEVYWDDIPF